MFILPPNNGTSGYSLVTDGNGNLSWSDSPEISQDAINTSGTQGGILFNNSGTMTTSDGIVYDNSNTFLGIGTTSPEQALDVANGYVKTGDANNTDGGFVQAISNPKTLTMLGSQLDSTQNVEREYEVGLPNASSFVLGSSTYSMNIHYINPDDIRNGADPNNFVTARYDGPVWGQFLLTGTNKCWKY